MSRTKRTDRSAWPAAGPQRRFLELLDRIREDNGRKSLQSVARAIHLSSATRVNDILRGLRPPASMEQVSRLARALGGGVEDAEAATAYWAAVAGGGQAAELQARPELPRLPGHFVAREAERQTVLDHLAALTGGRGGTLGLTPATALHGTGGFGKTTLALDICRHSDVEQLFPDGVVWVDLGQEPVVVDVLTDVTAHILRRAPIRFATLEAATTAFVAALGTRRLLLVLDNVWAAADLDPFLRGGPGCVRLVTTRRVDVLPVGTPVIPVGRMPPPLAAQVLCANVPGATAVVVFPLYERSHRWPVLLGILNGVLVGRTTRASAQPLPQIVDDLVARLDRRGVVGVDDVAGSRDRTAHDVLELGLAELAAEPGGDTLRRRFLGLAAYPVDHLIGFAELERLWECDPTEARLVCDRLADRSLLGTADSAGVRLHDVVHDHVVTVHAGRVRGWRDHLLDQMRARCPHDGWHLIPPESEDDLAVLAFLLAATNHDDELTAALFDLRYLARRVEQGGLAGLGSDITVGQTLGARNPRLDALNRILALEGHLAGRVGGRDAIAATLLARFTGEPQLLPHLAHVREAVGGAPLALHPMPDRPDARLLRVLSGHADRVLCVTWRPDGAKLASGSADGAVRVWNAAGGLLRSIELDGAVNALAWSPDQMLLAAVAGESDVHRIDPLHGDTVASFIATAEVTGLAWSPDSSTVAIATADGTVLRWAENGSVVAEPPCSTAAVRAIDWSAAGLVTAHSDGTLARRTPASVTSGVVRINVPRALHVRPGRAEAAVGGADRGIVLVDLEPEPATVADSGPLAGWVTSLGWNRDGQRLAAGLQEGRVVVWHAGADEVRDLDPADAATAAWQASLAADPHLDFHGMRVAAVVWRPTEANQIAVAASTDVRQFDVSRPARRLTQDGINCLCPHPRNGALAAGGIEGDLILFDRADLDPVHRTTRHAYSEQVRAVRYSPDARWIATAAEHGPLLLWRTDTLNAEPVPCPVTMAGAIAWSPDGSLLAVGGNGQVAIMDRSLEVVRRIDTPDLVNAVDIDPSGTRIAIATTGSSILVHDLARGDRLSLDDHLSSVGSVRWADDRTLLSAGYDGQALIWSIDSRAVAHRLEPGGGAVWDITVHRKQAHTVTSTGMLAWHDLRSGTTQGHIAFDTALSSCATTSDGVLAAAGSAGLALFLTPISSRLRDHT